MEKETIKEKLYQLQDLEYRNFSKQLLPESINLIGVRLPILRKLSKNLTLEELSDDTFEEQMLQGMIIGHIQDFDKFKKECLRFLTKIDNWSICDSFVSSLTITRKYPKEIFEFLNSLIFSESEFIRRFVLVMFLRYYITNEYLKKVMERLKEIPKQGYFVKMASSWLIAEIYLKNKQCAFEILKDSTYHLDFFIYQKSISKIKDSKKVSKEEKEELNQFKKQYENVWKDRGVEK